MVAINVIFNKQFTIKIVEYFTFTFANNRARIPVGVEFYGSNGTEIVLLSFAVLCRHFKKSEG